MLVANGSGILHSARSQFLWPFKTRRLQSDHVAVIPLARARSRQNPQFVSPRVSFINPGLIAGLARMESFQRVDKLTEILSSSARSYRKEPSFNCVPLREKERESICEQNLILYAIRAAKFEQVAKSIYCFLNICSCLFFV